MHNNFIYKTASSRQTSSLLILVRCSRDVSTDSPLCMKSESVQGVEHEHGVRFYNLGSSTGQGHIHMHMHMYRCRYLYMHLYLYICVLAKCWTRGYKTVLRAHAPRRAQTQISCTAENPCSRLEYVLS